MVMDLGAVAAPNNDVAGPIYQPPNTVSLDTQIFQTQQMLSNSISLDYKIFVVALCRGVSVAVDTGVQKTYLLLWKRGGFKNERMMVSILQMYPVCLPTVKKRSKDATETSTELMPSFYRT
jgi:hypothetical protein